MPKKIKYWIDPLAENLGVRFEVAVIRDVTPRFKDSNLERWRKSIQKIAKCVDIENDEVLKSYRDVLKKTGNDSAVASPEYLLEILKKSGRLPIINTIVDAYNPISAKTRTVVSAHDLDKLTGPIKLLLLQEERPFQGLGTKKTETIPIGEFGVSDDSHMLCRLNCKQSRLSSVDLKTRNILIYVQGNPFLEGSSLKAVLDDVCDTIIDFNGGNRVDVELLVNNQ